MPDDEPPKELHPGEGEARFEVRNEPIIRREIVHDRQAALEKVARMAARLHETIQQGEMVTERRYAGDVSELGKALRLLALFDSPTR
jgi:hypothetical protein